MLLSATGAMVMAAAGDLITLVLGLEILSLAVYVLSAWRPSARESEEAGMKYFLLGAFASAFLIYGMALVYGATGSFTYGGIVAAVVANGFGQLALVSLGGFFVLGGLSFKASLAPFHQWAPDVYTGAPTPVTTFMSVVVKTAAFAALLRMAVAFFPNMMPGFVTTFAVLVGLTMIEFGYTGSQAVYMSAVMFSGAAQLTAIELLAAGSTPVMVALASLSVHSRFMMFSASIAPHFAQFSTRVRWLFAYLLADLHYALTMAKHQRGDVSLFWYYLGSALAVYLIWVFSTLLGVLVGARIPESLELGFAISLVFLYLLLSLVDDLTDVVVATLSGTLAVAAAGLPYDAELLITPAIAVVLGYAVERRYLTNE
jgi:4-azaleucine resistance transporter AzlC